MSDNYIEISTGTDHAALLPPGGVLSSTESVGIAQLGDTIQSLIPQFQDVMDKVAHNLDSLQTTLGRGFGFEAPYPMQWKYLVEDE